MPAEGQTAVTIPQYIWNQVVEYYEKNKQTLRSAGIKSPTKLIQIWITEKVSQAQFSQQPHPANSQETSDAASQPHQQAGKP